MGIDYIKWKDHPANPLIEPPWPSPLLGDPAVLLPDETPNNLWHLFANSLLRLHHYTSRDGVNWEKKGGSIGRGEGWKKALVYQIQWCLAPTRARQWWLYLSLRHHTEFGCHI